MKLNTTKSPSIFVVFLSLIRVSICLLIGQVLFSCSTDDFGKAGIEWRSENFSERDKDDYQDDPDLLICDTSYGKFSHNAVLFIQEDDKMDKFTIKVIPNNDLSDTIIIPHVILDEWIPTIPRYLQKQTALGQIAIFNQQFNRVQAKFTSGFHFGGSNVESQEVQRVDIAKNCLHMPLWEIIAFKSNKDSTDVKWDAPIYHGWFNFPYELHTKLMRRKGWSNEKAAEITKQLSSWESSLPKNEIISLEPLRSVSTEERVRMEVFNDEQYPIKKYDERFKKARNIVYPKGNTMKSFLTDSTKFAKFISPGIYTKKDPMTTELGRFKVPSRDVIVRKITSKNETKDTGLELEFKFNRASGSKNELTKLIVGGIKLDKVDKQSVENANKASLQMPMGICNHPFSQSYKNFTDPKNSASNNSWYAMILDKDNHWLNSHTVGVDGILMHFDKETPTVLHVWLLSFERHALVSHFAIEHDWSKY